LVSSADFYVGVTLGINVFGERFVWMDRQFSQY
jgi:hypothetical protein